MKSRATKKTNSNEEFLFANTYNHPLVTDKCHIYLVCLDNKNVQINSLVMVYNLLKNYKIVESLSDKPEQCNSKQTYQIFLLFCPE